MDSLKSTTETVSSSVKRTLGPAPQNDAYLSWKASGVEQIQPDEEAKSDKIAATMNAMQRHNFDQVRRSLCAITSNLSNNFET